MSAKELAQFNHDIMKTSSKVGLARLFPALVTSPIFRRAWKMELLEQLGSKPFDIDWPDPPCCTAGSRTSSTHLSPPRLAQALPLTLPACQTGPRAIFRLLHVRLHPRTPVSAASLLHGAVRMTSPVGCLVCAPEGRGNAQDERDLPVRVRL